MDIVCAIQRVNGKDKILKCLWTGYGSRCQVHRFVSRTATLLGFSRSTVSCVYQEWTTTQWTSSQLDTTVWSIGVKMGHHPCGTRSTPCRVHALTNWGFSEGKRGVQLNIRKVFLMFGILSVYLITIGTRLRLTNNVTNIRVMKSYLLRWHLLCQSKRFLTWAEGLQQQ